MSRFTDSEIDQLKTEISLLQLVKDQGYQPSRQGKDHAMCCPFHEGDMNEYALQVTPANKSLGLVIRKAVWMGQGKSPKRGVVQVSH